MSSIFPPIGGAAFIPSPEGRGLRRDLVNDIDRLECTGKIVDELLVSGNVIESAHLPAPID